LGLTQLLFRCFCASADSGDVSALKTITARSPSACRRWYGYRPGKTRAGGGRIRQFRALDQPGQECRAAGTNWQFRLEG
jgi:hypothetical protein